jgi:hypothetical protein
MPSALTGSISTICDIPEITSRPLAALRDLMARMGQDSERAAMIYQHHAQGADEVITAAIEGQIEAATTGRSADKSGAAQAG